MRSSWTYPWIKKTQRGTKIYIIKKKDTLMKSNIGFNSIYKLDKLYGPMVYHTKLYESILLWVK